MIFWRAWQGGGEGKESPRLVNGVVWVMGRGGDNDTRFKPVPFSFLIATYKLTTETNQNHRDYLSNWKHPNRWNQQSIKTTKTINRSTIVTANRNHRNQQPNNQNPPKLVTNPLIAANRNHQMIHLTIAFHPQSQNPPKSTTNVDLPLSLSHPKPKCDQSMRKYLKGTCWFFLVDDSIQNSLLKYQYQELS